MKQGVIFWICWFCLSNVYGQGKLSYEVNSIFPGHLLENVEAYDYALDEKGFFWNTSKVGLQCFDGEKLISYNDSGESGALSLTENGHGYVHGCMVNSRYYWAIERTTHDLICFDTEIRRIAKRFVPPSDKIFYTLEKDEDENLFVLLTTQIGTDNKLYQVENFDTTTVFYNPNSLRYYDHAIHKKDHWFRLKENIQVYDSLGTLKRTIPSEEASCRYFSKGTKDSLVIYNRCFTEAQVYKAHFDSLYQLSIPDEVKDEQHNVLIFGDHVWFIGQQVKAVLWDRATNTIEDYTETIIKHYQEKENTTPSQRINQVITDGKGGYYLFGKFIIHVTPKSKNKEDYEIPINIKKPTFSMRESAEDSEGNIYTSFYTGVGVKERGKDTFVEFRNTSAKPKDKNATYSLTVWEDKLIWNNVIYDLNTNRKEYIHSSVNGVHVNHEVLGDTLWTFWWLSNTFVKTDLRSGQSIVVNKKIYPTTSLWASTLEYDEVRNLFWLSTDNNGIFNIDRLGNIVEHYQKMNLGSDDNQRVIQEMMVDDSLVWFCTKSSLGCLNINTNKTEHYQTEYTKSNGELALRSVYAIFEKNDSTLLLGTNKGIVKFNKNDRSMLALKSDHALSQLEFNRNALFQASDGRYYFGTVDGLYSFMEKDLEFDEDEKMVKPTVYKIAIGSNSSSDERTISSDLTNDYNLTLEPNESFVTIGLTTPNYGAKTGYSYQFLNTNQDWFDSGHLLNIPSLQTGDNTLLIKNAKASKEDETELVRINIYKKQFWYKKNWVIMLFVLGIIGLITLAQRWIYGQKIKREKELASLRTKISSDLHDDVGSILSGLAMQSEMLTYQVDEENKKDLREISSMSRDAMERMRDTVWTIDSRKDKYENLIDRMRSFAEKTLERVRIDHDFIIEDIDGKQAISPTRRQNVYLIFKEAVTNIVKHSDASYVEIKITQVKSKILLSITDNGKSSLSETNQSPSDGLGLSNMKLRAKNIDAVIVFVQKNGFSVKLSYDI